MFKILFITLALFTVEAIASEKEDEKEAFRIRLAELKADNVYQMHQQVYENRVSLIYLQYELRHPTHITNYSSRVGRVRDAYRVR